MSSIVKLSSQCEKCSQKDICNNKRMEACALAELPNNITNNIHTQEPNILSAGATNTINFNINIDKNVAVDNIKEQLKKQLSTNTCSFF